MQNDGIRVEIFLAQALQDLSRAGRIAHAFPEGMRLVPLPALPEADLAARGLRIQSSANAIQPHQAPPIGHMLVPDLGDWATEGCLRGLFSEATADRFAGVRFMSSIAAWVAAYRGGESTESYVSGADALAWAIVHFERETRHQGSVPFEGDVNAPVPLPVLGIGGNASTYDCEHPRMAKVEFDVEAALHLSADEVRKRWPRKQLTCPDCGVESICYASFQHYIAGDW